MGEPLLEILLFSFLAVVGVAAAFWLFVGVDNLVGAISSSTRVHPWFHQPPVNLDALRMSAYVCSVLFPIAGLVLGLVLYRNDRRGSGAVAIGVSLAAFLVIAVVAAAIAGASG